jgi:hypothetical protein
MLNKTSHLDPSTIMKRCSSLIITLIDITSSPNKRTNPSERYRGYLMSESNQKKKKKKKKKEDEDEEGIEEE